MRVRKAVIPAAGHGTRFLPASKAVPKPMIPVVDKPTIQYVVEEAVRAGIEDILIVTSRGQGSIEDHFDRSIELESVLEGKGASEQLDAIRHIAELADIHFVRQKEPRGLGHAVLTAEHHVGNDPFVVLLADNVMVDPLIEPMIQVYTEYGRSVVALQEVPVDQISSYGAAAIEPVKENLVKVVDIVEKPQPSVAPSNLGAIGRYVLTPEIFGALRTTEPGHGGEIQLTDAIRNLALAQAVYGYVYEGHFFDIGVPLGLVKATLEIAAEREDMSAEVRDFLADFAIRKKLV